LTASVQETYDRLASVYDRRWAHYTEATLRATLEGLDPSDGEIVLDLAAGTGELTRRLLGRYPGLRVVGLDLSQEMLLQGRTKRVGPPFELVQGHAGRLPWPSDSFDRIVCANSFHHFDAPERTLAEMRRVLRPGGWLTLTDWCDDYLSCRLCSLYLRLTDPSFQRAYTLNECHRQLEAAGFEVIDRRRFKIDWLWGLMRFDARR
jgi:ubiquinone/menaquinone biosynthesis C-methylase UbiE